MELKAVAPLSQVLGWDWVGEGSMPLGALMFKSSGPEKLSTDSHIVILCTFMLSENQPHFMLYFLGFNGRKGCCTVQTLPVTLDYSLAREGENG